MDVDKLIARQPIVKSQISSHIVSALNTVGSSFSTISLEQTLLEEQLSDGREWLFDTETPSLADAATHMVYNWALRFKKTRDVGDPAKFPNSLAVGADLLISDNQF